MFVSSECSKLFITLPEAKKSQFSSLPEVVATFCSFIRQAKSAVQFLIVLETCGSSYTTRAFLCILAVHLNNNSILRAGKCKLLKAGFEVQVFENNEVAAMYIVAL